MAFDPEGYFWRKLAESERERMDRRAWDILKNAGDPIYFNRYTTIPDPGSKTAEMFGAGWAPKESTDPMNEPLPVKAPATWPERERRVQWCLENMTNGELSFLYRLLHDGRGITMQNCRQLERAEKDGLK